MSNPRLNPVKPSKNNNPVDGYPNYDPAKAKKLLADYGKPVRIKFTVAAMPLAILTAQALQQMWKKVGIETDIEQVEQVEGIRMAAAKDYQVMLYRWAGGPNVNGIVGVPDGLIRLDKVWKAKR